MGRAVSVRFVFLLTRFFPGGDTNLPGAGPAGGGGGVSSLGSAPQPDAVAGNAQVVFFVSVWHRLILWMTAGWL